MAGAVAVARGVRASARLDLVVSLRGRWRLATITFFFNPGRRYTPRYAWDRETNLLCF